MRKITTLAIGLFSFVASNAQITKGSVYFGGSIGYSNVKEESRSSTNPTVTEGEQKSINISPAVGVALKENLVFGVDFNYGKSTQENINGAIKNDNKFVGAGIFVRRYFTLAKRFYAFGEISTGYADVESNQGGGSGGSNLYESNGWSVGATLYPGISYNVTKAFYLEMSFANLLSLNYTKAKQTTNNTFGGGSVTTERKGFSISSSLQNGNYLNMGVRFIIPKK